MSSKKIRLIIVEDHDIVRSGLVAVLSDFNDMEVIADVQNGEDAIAFMKDHGSSIDIAIVDIAIPGWDGIKITSTMLENWPKCRVVLLTAHDNFSYDGILAGASGYILKNVKPAELAHAIRTVYRGDSYLHPFVHANVMNSIRSRKAPPDLQLSNEDISILRGIAEGNTNLQIAQSLKLSEGTLKNRITAILRKLGAVDRASAVAIAIRNSLID